jgi:hypothetical protein
MADVLAALRIVIGADTAALTKGLKAGETSLLSFAGRWKGLAATLAGGLGFTGVAAGIKKAVDSADELGKMAQKIGVPVEELSKLKYAADLSEVSFEQLGKAARVLAKNVSEAGANVKGEMANTFKDLDIDVRKAGGGLKSVSEIMIEMAGRFGSAEHGIGKTAAALKLMGKSGTDMIPFLNLGAEGIRALMQEAEQLGLVFTKETTDQADLFNDNLQRLGFLWTGVATQLAAALLPALQRFSQFLIDAAKNGNLVANVSNVMTKAFDGLIRSLKFVYDNFGMVVKIIQILIGAKVVAFALQGAVAFARLARGIQAAGLMLAAFEAIRKISMSGLLLLVGGVALATGQFENLTKALSFIKEKIEAAIPDDVGQRFKDVVKSLGFDMKAFEEEMKSFDAGPIKKGMKDIELSSNEAGKSVKKTKDELEKLKEEGKQVTEEMRTPMEAFTARVVELDKMMAVGAITAETYARAVSKAKNEMIKADPAAQMLEQSLGNAFDRFLDNTMSAREQLVAFTRDLAKLAAMAAFKALLWGPSSGTAGSGLLGGFFGGNILGFAGGGSFTVPQGMKGGIDSQLLRVNPGEKVDIRTPGQLRSEPKIDVSNPVSIINAFDGPSFLSAALAHPEGQRTIVNFVKENSGVFRAALA